VSPDPLPDPGAAVAEFLIAERDAARARVAALEAAIREHRAQKADDREANHV
jgi:hypothetical protein